MTDCPNHNPVWIPSGHFCFACKRFYAMKGQELRPSYRTPEKSPPPGLFDTDGEAGEWATE